MLCAFIEQWLTIVAALAFQWLLDDQSGMFSHWVFKLTGERFAPLSTAWGARTSLIVINVWKNAPFLTIVFLAGLQGVPEELYEAARVDGANAWRRFWSITLPMVMPLLITMAMYFVVWQLASFDLVYGLTKGGPGVATNVLAHEIYRQAFLSFKYGFASAISVCLMVLVAVVGLLGVLSFRRAEFQ